MDRRINTNGRERKWDNRTKIERGGERERERETEHEREGERGNIQGASKEEYRGPSALRDPPTFSSYFLAYFKTVSIRRT